MRFRSLHSLDEPVSQEVHAAISKAFAPTASRLRRGWRKIRWNGSLPASRSPLPHPSADPAGEGRRPRAVLLAAETRVRRPKDAAKMALRYRCEWVRTPWESPLMK